MPRIPISNAPTRRPAHRNSGGPISFRAEINGRPMDPEILARIRAEMTARDLTQKEVVDKARARGFDLSKPSLNRILGGTQDPRSNTLRAIAAGIGIPIRELMTLSEDAIPEPTRMGHVAFIPVASLREGRWVLEGHGSTVPLPEDFLPDGRLVAFQLQDRAMEPEFSAGDWIVVNTTAREPREGEPVVIQSPDGGAIIVRAFPPSEKGGDWAFRDLQDLTVYGAKEDITGTVVGVFKRPRRIVQNGDDAKSHDHHPAIQNLWQGAPVSV